MMQLSLGTSNIFTTEHIYALCLTDEHLKPTLESFGSIISFFTKKFVTLMEKIVALNVHFFGLSNAGGD
jgi:hypothetical protein